MTDISLKHRIIAVISFALVSVVLSVRSALTFTLVFFACMSLVVFFADKMLNNEKIKERTALGFFVFAACYQTFYQLFNRTHENNKQLMVAAALALFLAGVFAATEIKNFPYSVLAATLICFLDIRIAAPYCLVMLTFSIVKFQLELKGNKFRKNSGKKKKSKKKNKETDKPESDPFFVIIISVLVSIVCLVFCIDAVFKNEIRMVETIDYALKNFKNFFGFAIFMIYLLIKLMRSEIKAKIGIVAGFILNLLPIPLYFENYGWSFVSMAFVSTIFFLGLICLEREDIADSIKEDCRNHRFLFFTELLLMLQ